MSEYSSEYPINAPPVMKVQVLRLASVQDRPTRIQIALWALILILMVAISVYHYDYYQFGTHIDDSRYAILARSLLSSSTYGMINVPGAPIAGKYPFGYPLLLLPSMVLYPSNLDAIKVPSLIATILIVTILFWGWQWFYNRKSYWWGLAVCGLYALAPMSIDHTRRVMSEPVFTFFCLLSILLAEMFVRGKQIRGWSIAMSVALTFAAFSRSIGIVLVIAVFAYMLVMRGRRAWVPVAGIILQIGLLASLVLIFTPVQLNDLVPRGYLKDENARFIVAFFSRAQSGRDANPALTEANVSPAVDGAEISSSPQVLSPQVLIAYGIKQHIGRDLRGVAFPFGGGSREQKLATRLGFPMLPQVIGYFVSGLIILGFIRLLRREISSLFLLFAVLYFGVIFLWIWNDPRLLYPIQPQIFLGLISGIEGIFLWISRPLSRRNYSDRSINIALASIVAFLLFASAYKSSVIQDSRLHTGDLGVRTSWFTTFSTPEDILMTEEPETDYIYSGRMTVPYPSLVSSVERLEDYLLSNRINYVLVAPVTDWQDRVQPVYSDNARRLLPMLEGLTLANRLHQVYSSEQDDIRIFQVLSLVE